MTASRRLSINSEMPQIASEISTTVSIVVPLYNEESVLEIFHERLSETLDGLNVSTEIIYINDGSDDGSLKILERLSLKDARITILDFSRNFGKEAAMTAGLNHADGHAVIVIDADLQDPPELIPSMLREWLAGYDMVYMRRNSRAGETQLKKITARLFYRFMAQLGSVELPEETGDFRLLSRRAVLALREFPERSRFMKGLFAWLGFSQKALLYNRDARAAGTSKWNYWQLWNLALEGITSFTTAPLKLASYFGLVTALSAFLFGIWVVIKTMIFGEAVQGYPTLMVVVLFLAGVQLVSIGIVGEYLGRIFTESKQRPLYILKQKIAKGQVTSGASCEALPEKRALHG